MKKIKKLLTIGLTLLLMLCMTISLVECKKTGDIYTLNDINKDLGITVQGEQGNTRVYNESE